MKRNSIIILISLLISLFIYLFYRTDRTLVNQLAIYLISLDSYTALKTTIARHLPLLDIIVYSLPEGLWVLCITLTSRQYYVTLMGRSMNCIYIPLIFSVGLELLQLFHITNGRFDLMDILVSFTFWLTGTYVGDKIYKQLNISTQLNLRTAVCLVNYCIVYLAHVFK